MDDSRVGIESYNEAEPNIHALGCWMIDAYVTHFKSKVPIDFRSVRSSGELELEGLYTDEGIDSSARVVLLVVL